MRQYGKLAKDPRGHHVRIYVDVFASPAWRALSFTERCLYFAMRQQLKQYNNGTITATTSTLAADGFTSSSTLHKSLRALIAVGLIECVVRGRMTFGGKEASVYRFTDEECFDIPKRGAKARKSTCEWKRYQTVEQAASAIAVAHADAKRPNHPNSKAARAASKVRNSNRKASNLELERSFSDSEPEQWKVVPIRSSNDGDSTKIDRQPASMLDSVLLGRARAEASHCSDFEHQCIVATPALRAEPATPLRMAAVDSTEGRQ